MAISFPKVIPPIGNCLSGSFSLRFDFFHCRFLIITCQFLLVLFRLRLFVLSLFVFFGLFPKSLHQSFGCHSRSGNIDKR